MIDFKKLKRIHWFAVCLSNVFVLCGTTDESHTTDIFTNLSSASKVTRISVEANAAFYPPTINYSKRSFDSTTSGPSSSEGYDIHSPKPTSNNSAENENNALAKPSALEEKITISIMRSENEDNTSDLEKESSTAPTIKKYSEPKPTANHTQRRGRRKGKSKKRRKGNKANGVTTTTINPIYSETSSSPSPSNKIRLPTAVVPVHYVLRLHPKFEGDFRVRGSVEIELEVREPTTRIKLHVSNISLDKKSVKVKLIKSHREIDVRSVRLNPRRHFVAVRLTRKLRPGRIYVISIIFNYKLNTEAKGFYRTSYIADDGGKRWIGATQFWPADARLAFPCFDEPGMKATFDVHLAHPEKMKALSNMPLVRSYRIKDEPEWIWDQFATSANMSTYLLAFVIMDFNPTTDTRNNETLLRVWTRDNMENRTSLAHNIGCNTLKFFERYFNLKFPLPKLDMIGLPTTTFEGMENWGLITYRESSLLHDNSSSSAAHSMLVSTLVAHEVAHQWFGNLVTFSWWNDLWLNEGFATYLSFVAVDNAEPSWNVLDQFVVTHLQESQAVDALPSSHSINMPFKDPARINEIFDSIPYSKGASIIRMMRHFLSEKTFKKGLTAYLHHYKYKNTRQDNLWSFLTQAAHMDKSLPVEVTVKSIMDTWTLQPGYPVVEIERFDNGTAILTQKRFLFGKMSGTQQKKENRSFNWWIPITFTSQERPAFGHTRAQTWLRQEDTFLRVTGLPPRNQWVIFNLQQTGYYRVNYDLTTWHLLIDQLLTNHKKIFVTNRAQLIDDSLNLARAGMLSYNTALQLLSYLRHEREYIPWKAGLRNLEYLDLMMRKAKEYGTFKNFVFYLLDPFIEVFNTETPKEEDSMESKLLKAEILSWLCRLEHPFCLNRIKNLTTEWNQNAEEIRFNRSIPDQIYCAAVRQGDENFWNQIWDLSKHAESTEEQSVLVQALGCTRHVWLLNRYLHAVEDPDSEILRQEGAQLYKAATKTAVGSYVAWDAFRNSWNSLTEFSDFSYYVAPSIIDVITESFNTKGQLRELQSFKDRVRYQSTNSSSNSDSQTSTRSSQSPLLPSLNKALATVEVNLKWMKTNFKIIVKWFMGQGYSSTLSVN